MTQSGAVRWGRQTELALASPVSGLLVPTRVIHVLASIKAAAAVVNGRRDDVGVDPSVAAAIEQAAHEVVAGRFDDQFPLDAFQTGSGTSTNMNVNEVIAHRASEILGADVHPNDHVNACQSSNDTVPSAVRLATAIGIDDELSPAVHELIAALTQLAGDHAATVTLGRTHLMDAVPMFFGQIVSGWQGQISEALVASRAAVQRCQRVPLGGSAVGTGLNVPPGWAGEVAEVLSGRLGRPVQASPEPAVEMSGAETYVHAMGSLRMLATALAKLANDLRFLGSGPFGGIAEIELPELQAGSSIMPGKVNPVIPEIMVQVAARVIGHDVTTTWAATMGNLQLNTCQPVIALALDESCRLLATASRLCAQRVVPGLRVDRQRCLEHARRSSAVITGVAKTIGYDRAASVVHEARRRDVSVQQVLVELGWSDLDAQRATDVEVLAAGSRSLG